MAEVVTGGKTEQKGISYFTTTEVLGGVSYMNMEKFNINTSSVKDFL